MLNDGRPTGVGEPSGAVAAMSIDSGTVVTRILELRYVLGTDRTMGGSARLCYAYQG